MIFHRANARFRARMVARLAQAAPALPLMAGLLAAAALAGCGSGSEKDAAPKAARRVEAKAEAPAPPAPGTVSVKADPPEQPPVGLEGERFDKSPVRQTTGLSLVKNGWTYDCMECHRTFGTGWEIGRERVEHKHIVMGHGMNEYCANCHHPENKNAFVWYDGSELPEAEVVTLCAKCHGPQHRDWKAGVHGRRNGYWNAEMGPQTRLRCIQCHDPHSPAFKPIAPKPPPPRVGAASDEFLISTKPGIAPLPASHGDNHGDSHAQPRGH